ncbi:hypothetical protein ACLKA6_017257 [Drosophila palustris]
MAKEVNASDSQNRVLFLKRKISALFERAKRIEDEISADKISALTIIELEVRSNRIAEIKSAFNLAHDSLEELDYNEIGSKVRDDFDELVITAEVRIRGQIQKRQPNQPPCSTFRHDDTTVERTTVVMANRPRIPELKLPTFSSGYTERDFYVDDLMTGGGSLDEVAEIMRQTNELLAKGNFQIRKWCSNVPDLLHGVPSQDKEKLLKFHDGTDCTKTLGLSWDPASDDFLFSVLPKQLSSNPTKRSLLSTIARFYDPLGLIGPVITKAKMFLQLLWKEQLHWDESLPSSLSTAWLLYCENLSSSQRFVFPRLAVLPDSEVEVHGFCDASVHAYGACIYVSSKDKGARAVHLLCSRSRVAPLKTLTVPKLELCGAGLLAQLISELYFEALLFFSSAAAFCSG